jgi:hypothetical protein
MRKGERALIMVKPSWGYGCVKNKEKLAIPRGWTTEEKRKELETRRVFFNVKLVDWVVRHDINGDSLMVKSILKKGQGYDRPSNYDEVTFDLKIY